MNAKVSKLLRFYARESGASRKEAKREWYGLNAHTRARWGESIREHHPNFFEPTKRRTT